MRRTVQWLIALGCSACALGPGTAVAQLPDCLPPLCEESSSPPPEQPPPPPAPPQGPVGETTGAVTDRVDGARSGHVRGNGLVPPVVPFWRRNVQVELANAPLVAGGRVFVAGRRGENDPVAVVIALDVATGRILWKRELDVDGTMGLGYDAGLLVATNEGGTWGLDAATGAPRWSAATLGAAAPTVTGGAVYGGNATALSAADGSLIWHRDGVGAATSPAVDGSSVFISGGCGGTRLERTTGAPRWTTGSLCSNFSPAAIGAGRMLAETTLLDAASGARVAGVPAASPPVLAAGRIHVAQLTPANGHLILSAVRASDGRRVWRRGVQRFQHESGWGLVGSGRWLYLDGPRGLEARSAATGRPVWRVGTVAWGSRGGYGYAPGLGAGPGILVATGGSTVTAFTSLFAPGARRIQALPDQPVRYGRRALVYGRSGRAVAGRTVRLRAGRRTLARVRSQADGFFRTRVRVGRNTRVRARSGRAHSRPFRVFVYPDVRLDGQQLSERTARAVVEVRAPSAVRFSGRRAEIYLARAEAHRYERLGRGGILRPYRPGRWRASFVVTFPPTFVPPGPGDFDVVCVHGQARLGMGDPDDRLLRRCGARRIRG